MRHRLRQAKATFSIACVAATSLAVAIYGLFHGYFDHGKFEIRQMQWSSSKQVAMVAERSDEEALGGLEYFVLIGNHPFTPAELRDAYHSNAVIVHSACNCLALDWDGPNRLIVKYDGSSILKQFITIQRQQIGEVAISYENVVLQ